MLEIEIVDSNIIEGGIEVFARAWNENGQIGFGKDGTIDVERFRIFNPPILVRDVGGSIVRERIDEITGEITIRNFREDPEEALLRDIERIISVKKEIHTDSNIVAGKIGNTTSTFRPSSGQGSAPGDGRGGVNNLTANWATTSTRAANAWSNTSNAWWHIRGGTTSNNYRNLFRRIAGYQTGATIPVDDVISSATLTLTSASDQGTVYQDLGVTAVLLTEVDTPSNENSLVTSDFDPSSLTYTTSFCDTPPNTSAFSAEGVTVEYSLNAAGLAYIKKGSGNTWFSTVSQWEVDDRTTFQGTWNSGYTTCEAYDADAAGTTDDPVLVVEHAAAVTNAVKSINGLSNVS